MLPKDVLMPILFFLTLSLVPGDGFLLPLLFPVSIKITIRSSHHLKPPPKPKPDYHFIPVYKEVVVKSSPNFGEVGGYKQSYGDGHKYGTSYGDGHLKVYTETPHVKKGYGSGYAELAITAGNHKGTDYSSIKGSAYIPGADIHYKGTPYEDQHKYTQVPEIHYVAEEPQGHYKGTDYVTHQPAGHYKGTNYQEHQPEGHYKGTHYQEQPKGLYKGKVYKEHQPEGHHKGTAYEVHQPGHHKGTDYEVHQPSHHKGTAYEVHQPEGHHKEGHHKGTAYEAPGVHYQGTDYSVPDEPSYGHRKKKVFPKNHSFIKAVQGYKITDYLPNHAQQHTYQENDKGYVSHVAIPPKVEPGHSYAEIAAAHKAKHGPKAYDSKQYADLGNSNKSPDYLDDSLPAYKYPPVRSFERSGLVNPTDPVMYAGYGTTFYGDSYGKIVYEPKNLRISIRNSRRH
ncbi:uncharacterized protein TNIN_225141 [Trichonephila inaurata madagascariensis]|uniref:Uncharacterized protein n=1 Tax=Trichonephila inaurata madagascariensis TaxID=2747483 RepID=A0A8X6YHV1_9ARAC|nr:uncharacterized protein TNIN_225141 [Trichonephila inaurata madagascariensis]